MKKELMVKFLESIKANSQLKDDIPLYLEGKNEDEIIKYFAKLAPTLDFDITEEDFREFFKSDNQDLKERTDATIAKVKEIDLSELETVSGGFANGSHGNCYDTFLDKENCWFNDGCDLNINPYNNYLCANTNQGIDCGARNFFGCQEVFVQDWDSKYSK